MALVVRWIDGDYADKNFHMLSFTGKAKSYAMRNTKWDFKLRAGHSAERLVNLAFQAMPCREASRERLVAMLQKNVPTAFGTSCTPSKFARPASTPAHLERSS